MNQTVSKSVQVAPFLVFYLIHSMQVGTGLLSFQRSIAQQSGYDAWISVILTGLFIHIIVWIIFKIVEITNGDLVSAHIYVLGERAGKIISSFFIVYFILIAITSIRPYIEIIQVWMYPELSTFWFTLPLLFLSIYIVSGGFRVVGGVAFFGAVIPIFIYLSLGYIVKYAEFRNLLPIFDHSMKELAMSGYHMSLSYHGFETLLIYYPFIQQPEKSKKWAHLGVFATTILYTIFTVITFSYFSERQLEISIWPTLAMWKIIQLPFIERFEYIGITIWFIMILPNVCIALWSASWLSKRIFPTTQRNSLIITTFICLIVTSLFKTTTQIDALKTITAQTGLIFSSVYIPILFLLILIMKRMKT